MTAPPSLREGRRLIGRLDELETATMVAAARPPAGRTPRMQAMVNAVHAEYVRALSGTATRSAGGGDSFAELRERARQRRPAPVARRGVEPPRAGAPSAQNIEPDVVERIVRYAGDLDEIAARAGPRLPRPPLKVPARRSATREPPARRGPPVVRASRLTPPDARRIRLAHELGTKPLTAWTVVWVSGDMSSAFSRRGEPAFVGFHAAFAANSLGYWRGMIDNVAQLLSTLLGFALAYFHLRTRPGLRSAEELLARLRRARRVSLRWVYRETWELIGQGGKVFETGTGAGLRSLLQPDGTIVTHARPAAFADEALTLQHTTTIDTWLARLLEQWKAANDLLQVLAALLWVLLSLGQVAAVGWEGVRDFLLRLAISAVVAMLARGVAASVLRRLIFRAR